MNRSHSFSFYGYILAVLKSYNFVLVGKSKHHFTCAFLFETMFFFLISPYVWFDEFYISHNDEWLTKRNYNYIAATTTIGYFSAYEFVYMWTSECNKHGVNILSSYSSYNSMSFKMFSNKIYDAKFIIVINNRQLLYSCCISSPCSVKIWKSSIQCAEMTIPECQSARDGNKNNHNIALRTMLSV